MRWLVAHPGPDFSVADVYTGWVEALRELGEDVIEFNLHDRLAFYSHAYVRTGETTLRKALDDPDQAVTLAVNGLYADLYTAHPDVLLVISSFLVPAKTYDLARRYGTKVILVHTESPYEDQRQLELVAHADLNLVNDPTNIDQFTALGPTRYLPHAYRPAVHKPGPRVPDCASELVFVGTAFQSRIDFFEAMDLDGIDVALAGNWQRLTEDSPLHKYLAHDIKECCDNSEAVRLYQSGQTGINFYRREAEAEHLSVGWACGPREIEMAACGLFFLRDPRPEGDELFPMLPTFAGPEDASEQLRWWLEHKGMRRTASDTARAAVADRTFTEHARQLLRSLDRQPVTI